MTLAHQFGAAAAQPLIRCGEGEPVVMRASGGAETSRVTLGREALSIRQRELRWQRLCRPSGTARTVPGTRNLSTKAGRQPPIIPQHSGWPLWWGMAAVLRLR